MATGLDLSAVHVLKKIPGQQMFRVAETHPALRLGSGDNVLYIQHGRVFSAGGDHIPSDKLPDWFKVELEKCSQDALLACGYGRVSTPKPARKPKVTEDAGTQS